MTEFALILVHSTEVLCAIAILVTVTLLAIEVMNNGE